MKLDVVRELANEHGLVDRRVAVGESLTRAAWRHLHDCGLLVPVAGSVSRVLDRPVTFEQSVSAVVISLGPGAVAAGRTAAALYGVGGLPEDPMHIIISGRRRGRALEGVVVHRPRHHLDLIAANDSGGVPVARPTRVLLDVAAWDPSFANNVLEDFVVKQILTIDDARAAVDRFSRQGRPGLKVLRRTVEAWVLTGRPPDSVLEERMAKLCRDHGLPPFEFQRPVGRFRPDFCRVREMVIVECDGQRKYLDDRSLMVRDRERDAELTAQGWAIIRFTWHQINKRSAWVASQIRATLRRREALLCR